MPRANMPKSIKKVSAFAVTTAIVAVVAMAFTIAPMMTSSAMADKGGVNPGGSTECVHNGNGATSSGACSNPSGTTVTCQKIHGKFTCS